MTVYNLSFKMSAQSYLQSLAIKLADTLREYGISVHCVEAYCSDIKSTGREIEFHEPVNFVVVTDEMHLMCLSSDDSQPSLFGVPMHVIAQAVMLCTADFNAYTYASTWHEHFYEMRPTRIAAHASN